MSLYRFENIAPRIPENAYVDPDAVVIGRVTLGEDSSIWPGAVVRGDVNTITIGARTNIQDGCVLHVNHESEFTPGDQSLTVGDDVTVGHRAVLHACRVGDRCLIGVGAMVLDGAVLPPETMVGAGSVVAPGKTLEGGYLWLGMPARRVRALTERERAYLQYSAQGYVALKNRHRASRD